MITIEDFKKKQTSKTRLIGLDLGSKRIGVSICDEKQSIATPYKTIDRVNTANLNEYSNSRFPIDNIIVKQNKDIINIKIVKNRKTC